MRMITIMRNIKKTHKSQRRMDRENLSFLCSYRFKKQSMNEIMEKGLR